MVEKNYSIDYSLTLFLSFFSMFLGMGTYIMYDYTRNDSYISCIIGIILSFAFFFIVKYIVNNNFKENIIELNKNIYGKIIGNMLNVIMLIGYYLIAIIVLYNISNFFNMEYLNKTSIHFTKVIILLPLLYIETKDIVKIIKFNQVFSIVCIVFFLISLIGVFAKINVQNLEPILNSSKENIIKSSIVYFMYAAVPTSTLLIQSRKNILDKENLNKSLIFSYIFSNISIFVVVIMTILVLGADFLSIFRFPEYIALKQFKLFNVFERIENILSLQFYFSSTAFISILMYFIKASLPKTKIYKSYNYIIIISMYILVTVFFRNNIRFIELLKKYLNYIILITIMLPVIITYIKLKIMNKKQIYTK